MLTSLKLLRNFDFAVVDPTHVWDTKQVGIWVHKNFNVRITERTAKE